MNVTCRLLCCLAITTLSGACQSLKQDAPAAATAAVTIMTFNVENLFDNTDDPGKDDATYLPLAAKQNEAHRQGCALIEVDRWREQCLHWDWSDELVERKLAVVAAAILQVNNGRGPDILALQEIENIRILERLRTGYLGNAGYLPAILIEGDDLRGIDVAFLSRLPLADNPQLHAIAFDAEFASRVADTRGILQADFQLPDGSVLTGFAVHFPAPFHPTGMRISAYNTLNGLRAGLPASRAAFAAGDFNTSSTEDAREKLLDRYVRPYWLVSHELCTGDCRGSTYYARDDTWSFLDMVLWSSASRGENATWDIRANSVRLANRARGQRHNDGTPARFDPTGGPGVSDHWPLQITVEPR